MESIGRFICHQDQSNEEPLFIRPQFGSQFGVFHLLGFIKGELQRQNKLTCSKRFCHAEVKFEIIFFVRLFVSEILPDKVDFWPLINPSKILVNFRAASAVNQRTVHLTSQMTGVLESDWAAMVESM